MRKLTTGQGENYTTWCLSDYERIKNHYRLISVDFSKEKELLIQQIKFVAKLKQMIKLLMMKLCLF